MSFLDRVQSYIKQWKKDKEDEEESILSKGVRQWAESKEETDAEKQVKKWRETGATGTPVYEDTPSGYFRGFDVAGKAGPTAGEILSLSPESRERQQQLAMKYKGRGFPTVDWRGPQGLVFTDGKPEYMDTGTTITPEKMGFAFSPKEKWKRPGVSEVTGLPDPIEQAKFSEGKGSVEIKDALRVQPKILTDEYAESWNAAHNDAMNLLPDDAASEMRSILESGEDVTNKRYREIIRKNAGLLTPYQQKVLEYGRTTTPKEHRERMLGMALPESRRFDPGTVTTRHTLTFPGEKISDAYYTTRKKTPADYGEDYFYSPLNVPGTRPSGPAISADVSGYAVPGAEHSRQITKGQFAIAKLPEWAEETQARPAFFDKRYTGRLVGEVAWDEDLASRTMQAFPQLYNFLSKHVAYIPELDKRIFHRDRPLINVEHNPLERAPMVHFLPSSKEFAARTIWGTHELVHAAISPETSQSSMKIANWLDKVIHVPDSKHLGLEKNNFIQDWVDHFGPNFWEIGYGMSVGLYEGAQKYINPFSRKNVWSSTKSLKQGMDEFTDGASFMAQGMANSFYRTIPGVDFENMVRYKPVEAALNMFMVRAPLMKKAKLKKEHYLRGADKAADRLSDATRKQAIWYGYNSARATDVQAKALFKNPENLKIVPDGYRFQSRYVDRFKFDAQNAAKTFNDDIAKSKLWQDRMDGLTLLSSPMNVFAPVELFGIAVRRLASGEGQGFLRNMLMSPLDNLASRKSLALFMAVSREGMGHNRKSLMYVQELADSIDSLTPEQVKKRFDKPEPGALSAAAVLREAGFEGPVTPIVPKDIRTTFNEMAWMEHQPIFNPSNPAQNIVKITKDGLWELTDAGKVKLKLGKNPETGKAWQKSEVDLKTIQLRNEVAGKVAAMNIWGVNLAKKSLLLSEDLAKLNLFHSPKQIRDFFWAQLFDPPAIKAKTADDIVRAQQRGESRSVAPGAAGSLLDNQLRRAGIPIEVRLVRVGEAIPQKIIDDHAALHADALSQATMAKLSTLDDIKELVNLSKGYQSITASLNKLLESNAPIDGKFIGELSKTAKAIDSLITEAQSMGAPVPTSEIARIKWLRKSVREKASKAMALRKQSDKLERGLSEIKARNKPDPDTGKIMGGYGMTNDFFRTATTGLGRMQSLVSMHKIYREAAKSPIIAKSYDMSNSKGWLKMPGESMYANRYKSMSAKQLKREAKNLRIPESRLKEVLARKGETAQLSGLRELVDLYAPKKYGDLANKWVHEDVWYHIINGQKLIDDMSGWYPELLSKWKSANTAWSPTTTIRNVLTNVLYFGPMAGLSILNPGNWKYYQQAIQDAFSNKKSQHWKETYEDGVFSSSFIEGELGLRGSDFVPMKAVWKTPTDGLKEFAGLVDRIHHGHGAKGWIKKRYHGGVDITKFPGIFYSKVCDDIFRQAYHHKYKSRIGRSRAASGAMEKFIDYKNVPGFVHMMRMPYAPYKGITESGFQAARGAKAVHYIAGQPFITFTARAIPLTTEWLMRNPVQAQVYMTIHDAMTAHSFANAGVSPEGADGLYAMTEGMNKWERFRFAPAASMSLLSFLDGGDKQVPAASGEMFKPTDRAYEKRHLFVDTNFLNPFGYLSPGFDPIEGNRPLEYLRRTGFLNHFLAVPLMKAFHGAINAKLDGEGLVTFHNEMVKGYAPQVFPSPSDIASVFGGSPYSEMVKLTGESVEEWNRYKGGRFWEKAAGAWNNWVDRDGYARPITERLFEMAVTRTKGYTKTELIINRAQDLDRYMSGVLAALNKKHNVTEEDFAKSLQNLGWEQKEKALEELVSTKGQAKRNELVLEYGVPAVKSFLRVIYHMPNSRAKVDFESRSSDFIENPTWGSLKDLLEVVNLWSGEQRDIINSRRILLEAKTPMTEEQREWIGE